MKSSQERWELGKSRSKQKPRDIFNITERALCRERIEDELKRALDLRILTNRLRYGTDFAIQNASVFESINFYGRKPYIFPDGRTVFVRGF